MKKRSISSLAGAALLVGAVHVLGAQWPEPPVIDPGPRGGIPSDAVVLFDGADLSAWHDGRGGPARWEVRDGMAIVNGTGNIFTRQEFGDCQLHVEWAAPEPVAGQQSQGRGNSGVYLQGRYEIQILDSYENRTSPDGQAGAFYGNFPPLVNASRKPGEWQTFDIIFRAPKAGEDGALIPGSFSVLHNGVLVQDHVPIRSATTAAAFQGPAEKGPLMLQDHGNPVRFKRIWLRPLN